MSLALGALAADIRATAEADGWWLRGPALPERLGQPGDPAAPGLRRDLLEVEQMLEMGFAELRPDGVVVPWDALGDALSADLTLPLRWTTDSPLMLSIDRTSDLGYRDFTYRYAFRLGAREVAVERVGYFVRHTAGERTFHLDGQTYALVEAMDRFNALPEAQRTKRESWLTFAQVKGCSEAVGASLDAALESNDVVVPSQIGLKIYDHGDGSVSFVPTCPELPGTELEDAFLRTQEVDGFYSIDRPDGDRIRVVLAERHRQVLERMKQVWRVRDEQRARAERHPQHYFDGLLDAVEIHFWARVTGIGELPESGMPKDPRAAGGFFEGGDGAGERPDPRQDGPLAITVPSATGAGDVRLVFSSADAVAEARRAVATALERGDPAVEFEGEAVEVSPQLLEALARDPAPARAGPERGVHSGRRFLLVHTNEEVAWSPPGVAQAAGASAPTLAAPFALPRSLTKSLKAHQLAGLQWLRLCDQLRPDRRGVLLADDMGLGKTAQVLTHLAWLVEQGRLRVHPLADPACAPWRPILIVAPLILVENETWQREMADFFAGEGDLFDPVLVLHGSTINRVKAALPQGGGGPETVIGRPTLDAAKLMQYRTVITNYETVVNYQHSLAQLLPDGRPLWSAVVTDEAQKFKTPGTKLASALKAIDADFVVASTGTPVENRLLDLWNIMDTLQPAHLGTAQEFSKTYEQALEPEIASATLTRLRRALHYGEPHAFLLRRTKQDLLQGDLPPKTIVRLRCALSPAELAAHQELLRALPSERLAGRHLAVLHRLGQLYQHPALLRDRERLPGPDQLKAESAKLQAVIRALHDIRRKREKAIIFARLIDMQQMLAAVIEHEFGIPVPIINGGTAGAQGFTSSTAGTGRARDRRKRVLDDFRARDGFGVIVLSPFVAGVGLTITEANHVIHYGRWWNPAVEAQATDRAYRIGQTRPVSVYLPILVDPSGTLSRTFDERLDAILESKTGLAHDFLHPADNEAACAEDLCDGLEEDLGTRSSGAPFGGPELAQLAPHDFEAAVAALYQARGYRTVLTPAGGDGGADVIAVRYGSVELVQAKHSGSAHPVDVPALSDLLGAMDIYREELGCPNLALALVTNSTVTAAAQQLAKTHGIRIVTGKELSAQMKAQGIGIGAMVAAGAAREKTFRAAVRAARGHLAGAPTA